MRRLPSDAPDQATLDLVREWVGLLAAEDYVGAYRLVASREHWSAELMRTVIQNYGSTKPHPSGQISRVTPIADTKPGNSPRHCVERYGIRRMVEFTLPLDREWSDLTALFDVEERGGDLVLVLDDIHVL